MEDKEIERRDFFGKEGRYEGERYFLGIVVIVVIMNVGK